MYFWSYHPSPTHTHFQDPLLIPIHPILCCFIPIQTDFYCPDTLCWLWLSEHELFNLSSPRQKCPISGFPKAHGSCPNTLEEQVPEEDRLAGSILSDTHLLCEWLQVSCLGSPSSALPKFKPKLLLPLTHRLCPVSKSNNVWHRTGPPPKLIAFFLDLATFSNMC